MIAVGLAVLATSGLLASAALRGTTNLDDPRDDVENSTTVPIYS